MDTTFNRVERGVRQLDDQLEDLQAGVDFGNMLDAFNTVRDIAGEVFETVSSAAQAIADTFGQSVERLSQLNQLARVIDIPVEQLQAFQQVAREAGVDQDALNDILTDFAERLGDAVAGGGELKEVLESLGLDPNELAALPVAEAFERVAEGVGELPTRFQQLDAAAKIASDPLRDNIELLDLLAQEGDQLGQAIDDLRNRGVLFSQEQLDSVTELTRNMNELVERFLQLVDVATVELAPSINELLEELLGNEELWTTLVDATRELASAIAEEVPRLLPVLIETTQQLTEILRLLTEITETVDVPAVADFVTPDNLAQTARRAFPPATVAEGAGAALAPDLTAAVTTALDNIFLAPLQQLTQTTEDQTTLMEQIARNTSQVNPSRISPK